MESLTLKEKLDYAKALGIFTESELDTLRKQVVGDEYKIEKQKDYKKKWDVAVQEVMNEFDFENMHNIMVLLKWSWYSHGVPTISEIEETALVLFDKLYKEVRDLTKEEKLELRTTYVKSGGLSAQVYFFKDDDSGSIEEELSLIFEAVDGSTNFSF